MKKVIILSIGVFLTVSCTKMEQESKVDGGLWLKMGDNSIVHTSDINFYDVSTHIIYLKRDLPYLENVFQGRSMTVNVGNTEIYQCSYYSLHMSYLPTGAYISNLYSGEKYIIRISFQPYSDIEDPRSDKRIIAALKKYGQYHAGLHIEVKSVQVSNGKVVLLFELSNHDTFDYYYLDPDKMGIGLFSYFTNGPTFLDDPPTKFFTHQETVIHPEPWDSWKKEWLSLIKSGQRKNITLTYNQFETMPAGEYSMNFYFPGLNHGLSQKDLMLNGGHIWMGNLSIQQKLKIKN